jgi:hypothetical protein
MKCFMPLKHAMNSGYEVKRSLLMGFAPKELEKRSLIIQIANLYEFETSRRSRTNKMPKKPPGPLRIGLQRPEKLLRPCRIRICRLLCSNLVPSTCRALQIYCRIAIMSINYPVRKWLITGVAHY